MNLAGILRREMPNAWAETFAGTAGRAVERAEPRARGGNKTQALLETGRQAGR